MHQGERTRVHLSIAVALLAGASLLGACGEIKSSATTLEIGDVRVLVGAASFKDRRDRHVVKQAFDYSCGAAALATLLTYGFDDPAGEREILAAMLATLAEEEEASRKKEGFSLLDMQRVAQQRGYRAQGFRLAPEFLDELAGPVIVFIEPRGYEHFAVLRGVRGKTAYLADPSRGNVREPRYAFLDMWLGEDGKGVVFVIEPEDGDVPARPLLAVRAADRRHPERLSVREMLDVQPTPAQGPRGSL